jgi:hypothetical protein
MSPTQVDGRGRRNIRPPGLTADVAEFRRVAIRDRWGLGLMAIAWVHLATFLACHAMYSAGDLAPPRYLLIWALELVVVVVLLRRMVTNNGCHPAPPLVGLLARIWVTFLILAFSVASLNQLSGMPPEWFKPVWCTLSTFGFAMMAWVVSLWFLVPAVQMSLTAMLIARFPKHAYLIYSITWWVALHIVALTLEKIRQAENEAAEEEPSAHSDRATATLRSETPEIGSLVTSHP